MRPVHRSPELHLRSFVLRSFALNDGSVRSCNAHERPPFRNSMAAIDEVPHTSTH